MNYTKPEIILLDVIVENCLATSISSDQIYFTISDSDNEFTKVESSN